MLKNVAGQKIGAQIVDTDGAAFTGSVTVYVTGDAGTQAAGSVGSGACTNEGNGYYTYAPAQAETNYDLIAFTFVGTGAVPVTLQVYPQAEVWSAANERAALGLASNNVDAQLSALAGYIDTEVAAILAGVAAIPTTPLLAANYTAPPSVSAIRAEMDANSTKLANLDATIASRASQASVDALNDFNPATDTVAHVTLVDTATTLTNPPSVPTESEIAAATLNDEDVETGVSLKQAVRLILAALAGKLSGADGTTITIRDVNDGKNRIVATVDKYGNRTAVTVDTSD